MIRLDLPLTRQTADEQLNFSSEMVSIDEFESLKMKLENEQFRFENLNKTGINNPKTNVSIVANPLKETIV